MNPPDLIESKGGGGDCWLAEEGGKQQQQAESAPGACSFDLAMPPYLMILPQYSGSYHKDSSMGLSTVIYMFFQLCWNLVFNCRKFLPGFLCLAERE